MEPGEYLTQGTGKAYGLELKSQYKSDHFGLMFSYTLAQSDRQYEQQNLGLAYPFEFDYRHQYKLFFYRNFGPLQFGVNAIYLTANPEISLLAVQSGQGLVSYNLNPPGQKNQLRSESYHRIDFSCSYTLKKSKISQRFKIGATNLLNHKNISFQNIKFDSNGNALSNPIYSLAFLPSFQYSIQF